MWKSKELYAQTLLIIEQYQIKPDLGSLEIIA